MNKDELGDVISERFFEIAEEKGGTPSYMCGYMVGFVSGWLADQPPDVQQSFLKEFLAKDSVLN